MSQTANTEDDSEKPLTIPAISKRSRDPGSGEYTYRDEMLRMRAEDRWSKPNPRPRSQTGNQTDHLRKPWSSMVESAPPVEDYGGVSDDQLPHARQLRPKRRSLDITDRNRPSVHPSRPRELACDVDCEALGLRPGWAKKALEAGSFKNVPAPTTEKPKQKVIRREHSFYCTSKGMIPGVLSFTSTVLTFEPTANAEFQCIIAIADIWEVASIVVPKTSAVERLFNLPPSTDVMLPKWAKHKPPAVGENPNPSLALIQILLRQKTGRPEHKAVSTTVHGGRRDSLHRVGDFQRVGSKDTTPASTTFMEDFHSIKRNVQTSQQQLQPRHFILFRVPNCTTARDITKNILALIRQINDNARHFTYVPFYSEEALNDLIRCSSMAPELDNEWREPPQSNTVITGSWVREDLFDNTAQVQNGGLSLSMMNELSWRMPPTIALRKWQLLFDTTSHGVSMQTFYSRIKNHEPALLCIRDSGDHIFGGYSPVGFEENRHYYGSGETFVFTFGSTEAPQLQTYHWTGCNNLFVYSSYDRIIFGGGSNSANPNSGWAFAVDGNMLRGTSADCPTFDNPILSSGEDWIVQRIQVWGFEAL